MTEYKNFLALTYATDLKHLTASWLAQLVERQSAARAGKSRVWALDRTMQHWGS